VRGKEPDPETGFMCIRAGKINYRAVFPISLVWLKERDPVGLSEAVARWSTGERFALWALCGGTGGSAHDLEREYEAQAQAVEQKEAPLGRCESCERPLKVNDEGTILHCPAFYPKPGTEKCDVKFRIDKKTGEPIRRCKCGQELVLIEMQQKPNFMGCPDHCEAKENQRSRDRRGDRKTESSS
jgi:hypothetical protein